MDGSLTTQIRLSLAKLSIPVIALTGSLCFGTDADAQLIKRSKDKAVETTEPVHREKKPIRNGLKKVLKAVLPTQKKDQKKQGAGETGSKRGPNMADGSPLPAPGNPNIPPAKPDSGTIKKIPGRVKTVESHALDPAITFAKQRLDYLQNNIRDYQGYVIKQERIGGRLMPAETMKFKVINRVKVDGKTTPLSIYMKFLKPRSVKGREVIWVEGQNDNKLMAHEAEPLNFMTVPLDPKGMMAMRNNRYPITDFGIQNLVEKLIERASRDREHGDCQVDFFKDAKVKGRPCQVIQVKHDEQRPPFDFHIARIYIDEEYQIPVRYEAYLWPEEGSKKLKLLESYTYVRLKFNTGLTPDHFSVKYGDYDFP